MGFASEELEEADEDESQNLVGAPLARLVAERQRRVWATEPPERRDEILPYFIRSIVHDENRPELDLKVFLEVRKER